MAINALRTHRGSAKDIHVLTEPTNGIMGTAVFEFRDDYSVFDYGVMPDQLPGKGAALAAISAYNFREIAKLGVKTHMAGMEDGMIKVKMARVLYPQKGEIHAGEKNYLVPLEVIFRNSLPAGSSVFKRIDRGETTWQKLGFSGPQKPGTRLDQPLLDVATKLEPTDRYMDWAEAQDMAKLSDAQLAQVKDTALKVDDFLNKKAASLGLYHEDGKVEFVMDDRGQLLLADVFGTLDENRFTRNGKDVSKQVIRDYYKKTPWYAELEAAKKTTDIKTEWPKPPKLAGGFAQIVGNIYKSFAQEWTGENKWNAPTLAKALDDCDAFLAKMK